jgi:hypothetical protein
MPNSLRKPPPRMTVADFIGWPGDGTGGRSQLIDGEVREIPPGSVARGLIHTNVGSLVASHLFQSIGLSCPLVEVYAEAPLGEGYTS